MLKLEDLITAREVMQELLDICAQKPGYGDEFRYEMVIDDLTEIIDKAIAEGNK